MRKTLLLGLALVAVAGSSAFAYWSLLAEPEPVVVPVEQKYEDIQRGEYEKWMQDLGYTE
ncbi:MAG: hypothetical protein V4850_04770 [Myxococcota bacterium]